MLSDGIERDQWHEMEEKICINAEYLFRTSYKELYLLITFKF